MYRAVWNCTELLKANDRVLLTIGTFVHVLILSKHSVLCLVFFCTRYFFSKNAATKVIATN